MRAVPIGAKGTYALRVRPEHLANQFKDEILPRVFSTPMMVLLMENAALEAVRPYLGRGESCVGTVINVRHLTATPVGQQVRAEAEVTRADGRHIEFNVAAHDEDQEIGRGTHERMVIDLARFNERLAQRVGDKRG